MTARRERRAPRPRGRTPWEAGCRCVLEHAGRQHARQSRAELHRPVRVMARITRCELGREEKRSTASGYRRGRAGWRVGSRGGQRTFASEYSSSTSELVRILASPDSGSAASDVSDRRWPSGTESLVRTAALPFRRAAIINSKRSWATPNRYLGEYMQEMNEIIKIYRVGF